MQASRSCWKCRLRCTGYVWVCLMFENVRVSDAETPEVGLPEVEPGKRADEPRSPANDTCQTSFPTDFLELPDGMLDAEIRALRRFFERS